MITWGDFETRSKCDLTVKGAYNYALDASTAPLCFAYAYDDGPVMLWLPGEPFPELKGQLRAHNAAFDRLILTYVIGIDTELERWYCTAVQAAANGLPRSLEDVGRAAKSEMRKDYRGGQLIRLLSVPQADGTFNNDPALLKEMYDYCKQDVETMRAVSKSLRDLTPDELADYHVNERINDRGVLVDVELCRAAMRYSDAEVKEIQALVADITKGAVPTVRSPKMREWVQERVGPQALKLMTRYEDGEKKFSIDKTVRANLLALAEEDYDEIPADVADVIQCADDMWASSVAKFSRLASLADDEDSRVRGAFVFNGGSATGRIASYGAQLQNLPRKSADDPVATRSAMVSGAPIAPVSAVLKSMLRPALIPALGNVFVCADWSQIEARVNPWLSAQPSAQVVLDIFRSGADVYRVAGAKLHGVREEDVTPAQRQIEKVKLLACGFNGGKGAFAKMGRAYNVHVDEAEAIKMVNAWRRANPWCLAYGQQADHASRRALRNPGHEFVAGRCTLMYDGEHLWYALPSGRILRYPYAKFEGDDITYLKAAWKPAADATEWPRAKLWAGTFLENWAQATANDLLRFSCRQIDGIVLTAHDEIVVESTVADAEKVADHVRSVMTTTPAWAEGLPLAVEIKIMEKYGK